MVVVGGGEDKERREIVGVIRGCIKTVACGTKLSRNSTSSTKPVYTKLAYILGLRVSSSHRLVRTTFWSMLHLVNFIE